MYRTSSDRRFYKIKKDIRGAFMTLVLQKDHYSDISITEVAELADINRKTLCTGLPVTDVFIRSKKISAVPL